MAGFSWLHRRPSHASGCTVLSRKGLGFFAQSVLIKLASPQSAWLSIFLIEKISSVAPPRGTSMRDALLIEMRREEKKAQHLAGLEPSTSRVLLLKCVLYCYNPSKARNRSNLLLQTTHSSCKPGIFWFSLSFSLKCRALDHSATAPSKHIQPFYSVTAPNELQRM